MKRSRQNLFDKGYRAGYEKGKMAGYSDFNQAFEGTSIIIPTYNKKELLLQCLDSIAANTPFPYELIVVDDGSNDGTAKALQARPGIRLAVHESNKGFSGAVNTGLMMAKGKTILILNNDVIVTERWLENMLACLHSSPDIGAVGPVTNYIGGEQQIEVPYRSLAGMRQFATERNQADQAKWRAVERLVGFCLLLRREAILKTGFFDEGFRVGNYEDDDYCVRLRLLGWRLVIAGDSFIHHLGSETMRGLDARLFEETGQANKDYFHLKWGQVHEAIRQMEEERKQRAGEGQVLTDQPPRIEGFPVQLLASSGTGHLYWINGGLKYRIKDTETIDAAARNISPPIVRTSHQLLRALPSGGELGMREVLQAWSETGRKDRPIGEGTVIRLPNGRLYQIDHGAARRIWSDYAAEAWGLRERARAITSGELAAYPEGWPILPPISYNSVEF